MLPLLELLQDGQPRQVGQIYSALADRFHLTTEERVEVLPSGLQSRFENRVGWACTYLKKAKLAVSPKRGTYEIAARGKEVLAQRPTRIDLRFLDQYEEVREFRKSSQATEDKEQKTEVSTQTPEEILEVGYQTLRASLAQEMLDRIRQASPAFFEKLVIELLLKMGYGGSKQDAGSAIGRSGDGGIDGIIKEDKLGLDVIYVQAKRWGSTTVGRPDVQAFAGSLEGFRARKGVFITTSQFSGEAGQYVTHIEKKIVLIDGHQLSELMIDHGLGVTTVVTYEVRRVDTDYFSEE
jgi:restriction system protein